MTMTEADVAAARCPHSDLAEEFDPWSDDYLADPYPFFARARAEAPVFYNSRTDLWMVSRYDDIWTVLRDPARFSAANALSPVSPFTPEAQRILLEGGYTLKPALTNNDPPGHTRVRSHINRAFSARRIAQLEPRIREYADGLIDAFVADGRADLIRQFAYPLPIQVVFRLIGIPEEDMDQIKDWCGQRVRFIFGKVSPEEQVACARNLVAFWQYIKDFCELRRREPQDDLTSELAAVASKDESLLDMHEVASVVMGLGFAGHETTTNMIGSAVMHLLNQGDSWARLGADPSLVENAVEELLRYDGSVPVWRRVAKEAVELGGVTIPAGGKIALLLASANHDESHFSQPDTFDIERTDARDHLAFGKGIHFCIGAALGRLEIGIALERLAQRLPWLRLTPGQRIEYVPTISFRGPKQLMIEWDASAAAD
jgi:cytochrome P450